MCFNPISLQKLGMVPKSDFQYHLYTNSWSSSMAKIHFMYIVGLPRDSCSLSFPSQFLGKRRVGI